MSNSLCPTEMYYCKLFLCLGKPRRCFCILVCLYCNSSNVNLCELDCIIENLFSYLPWKRIFRTLLFFLLLVCKHTFSLRRNFLWLSGLGRYAYVLPWDHAQLKWYNIWSKNDRKSKDLLEICAIFRITQDIRKFMNLNSTKLKGKNTSYYSCIILHLKIKGNKVQSKLFWI